MTSIFSEDPGTCVWTVTSKLRDLYLVTLEFQMPQKMRIRERPDQFCNILLLLAAELQLGSREIHVMDKEAVGWFSRGLTFAFPCQSQFYSSIETSFVARNLAGYETKTFINFLI